MIEILVCFLVFFDCEEQVTEIELVMPRIKSAEHKRIQNARRLKLGKDYQNNDLVFASSIGTPKLPTSNVTPPPKNHEEGEN